MINTSVTTKADTALIHLKNTSDGEVTTTEEKLV